MWRELLVVVLPDGKRWCGVGGVINCSAINTVQWQFYPAVVVGVNMERKKSKRQEEAERKVAIEKPELKDWEAVKSDLWVPWRLLSEIFCFHPTLFLFETCAAVSFFSLSQSITQKLKQNGEALSPTAKAPNFRWYLFIPFIRPCSILLCAVLITVLRSMHWSLNTLYVYHPWMVCWLHVYTY